MSEPEPPADARGYCDRCGRQLAFGGGHDACRAARKLEPPRYCARCGRRTVVKVTPDGWSSHCTRHGLMIGSG
jgi:NADH pyrophosphatase NudC (nudix superfamily)